MNVSADSLPIRPPIPLDPELFASEAARRRLLPFIKRMYPGYCVARMHEELCQRLQQVESGGIKRLIIEMPPRHGKSLIMSIHFPAWYLGRNPRRHIIATSYGAALAYHFSRQARNLFADPDWPFPVRLARDAQGVEEWLTEQGGGYVAAGVGGPITGKGADCLLIDDPVKNYEEAYSQVSRDAHWNWYTSTARTRLQPHAAIVLTMTRWHEDDLAGRLIKAMGQGGEHWEVFRLPALAEGNDPLGRQPGEALWPEWFPVEALETIRRTVPSRDWYALYQQRPMAVEGAMFKRSWFPVIPSAPMGVRWVRFWDLAASIKTTGDFTVGAKCGFTNDGTLVVADICRGRWEWPDALAIVEGVAKLDGAGVVVGIEGIGVQRGFRQMLLREPSMRGIALIDVPVHQDKLLRAAPWQARAEMGKLVLVEGPWNTAFIEEVTQFPAGEYDDQVDAVSGAVQMLAQGQRVRRLRVERE